MEDYTKITWNAEMTSGKFKDPKSTKILAVLVYFSSELSKIKIKEEILFIKL